MKPEARLHLKEMSEKLQYLSLFCNHPDLNHELILEKISERKKCSDCLDKDSSTGKPNFPEYTYHSKLISEAYEYVLKNSSNIEKYVLALSEVEDLNYLKSFSSHFNKNIDGKKFSDWYFRSYYKTTYLKNEKSFIESAHPIFVTTNDSGETIKIKTSEIHEFFTIHHFIVRAWLLVELSDAIFDDLDNVIFKKNKFEDFRVFAELYFDDFFSKYLFESDSCKLLVLDTFREARKNWQLNNF